LLVAVAVVRFKASQTAAVAAQVGFLMEQHSLSLPHNRLRWQLALVALVDLRLPTALATMATLVRIQR
jgi:hypothetical protein